jgi:hypothetical protein
MSRLDDIKRRQQEAVRAGSADPYQPTAHDAPTVVAPQSTAHYQAAMDADLATLAGIRDIGAKNEAKIGMIKTYWPLVDGYLQNKDVYPNAIAVRVMIWLFDIQNIEQGLKLAFRLIDDKVQVSPAKFDRDLQTFVCDAVYDWANWLLKTEQSAEPYLSELVDKIVNDSWSLSPPVESKMYALLAKFKLKAGDFAAALTLCETAELVNPEGAGVKTLKSKAKQGLEKNVSETAL